MSTPLTVIVITHNRLEYTKRTLESLMLTVPHAEFIVYDNHSADDVRDYLTSLQFAPVKARIILADDNVGWGTAVNYCLRSVKTEFILVSNNDVIYQDGWFEKCTALYEKYPKIGVLGVWKHTNHGTREMFADLHVKDDMPGVGWLLKRSVIDIIGAMAEHGPCTTKGGNGEDTSYTRRAHEKGYWVCGPAEDVADHIDGY